MRRPTAARNTMLTLLVAVVVLVPVSAGAQVGKVAHHQWDFCSADSPYRCDIWPVQTIDDAYRYGQAVVIDCGEAAYPDYQADYDRLPPRARENLHKPFDCPRERDVDLKVTVIKSVKNALGLRSTTISAREANGPLRVKLEEDEEKQTYYFMPLRANVERKMKAKKVRTITVTVSGTATGRDGKTKRFKSTRAEWSFNGNCQGRDLKMQRHLTYGGTCYRH
jgi:hypothetical protein